MKKKPGFLSTLAKILFVIMFTVGAYIIISGTMNKQNLVKARELIEVKQYDKAQKLLEKPTLLKDYKQKESLLEVYHFQKDDEKIEKLIKEEGYLKTKFRTKEILLCMYLRQENVQGIKNILQDIKNSDNVQKDKVLHKYKNQIKQLLDRDNQEQELNSSENKVEEQINIRQNEKLIIKKSDKNKFYVIEKKDKKEKFIGQIPTTIEEILEIKAKSHKDDIVVLLTGLDNKKQRKDKLFIVKNHIISQVSVKEDVVMQQNPETEMITVTALNGKKRYQVDKRYLIAKKGTRTVETDLEKDEDNIYLKQVSQTSNKKNTIIQNAVYLIDVDANTAALKDYDLKTEFNGKLCLKDEKEIYTIEDAVGKWLTDQLDEKTNGLIISKNGFKVVEMTPKGTVRRYQGYAVNKQNTKVEQVTDEIIIMTGKAQLSGRGGENYPFSLKIEFDNINQIRVNLQGENIEPQPEITYKKIK